MTENISDRMANQRRGEAAEFLPRAMDNLIANVDKALEGPIRWGRSAATTNYYQEGVTSCEAGELASLEDGRLAGLAYRLRNELKTMRWEAARLEQYRDDVSAARDRFLEQIESLHRRRKDLGRLFDERIAGQDEGIESYRDLVARGEAAIEAIEREQERRKPATVEDLQRVVEEQGRRLEELGAAQGKGLLARNKAATARNK